MPGIKYADINIRAETAMNTAKPLTGIKPAENKGGKPQ
jgi:hypothetical protein